MTKEITFLAQFTNFKFIKSTGTWRIELDLFEKDRDQVPIHSTFLEKVVKVTYSEYDENNLSQSKLEKLFSDQRIQTYLGTSGTEETKLEIQSRTGVDFKTISDSATDAIIDKLYKAIE